MSDYKFATVQSNLSTTMKNEMLHIRREGVWTAEVTDETLKIRRGKAFVNVVDKELTFIQDQPRGERSTEVGRSLHGRMRKKPNGRYGLNFTFAIDEKFIKENLLVELRNLIKAETESLKRQKAKTKKEVENDPA